MARHYLILVDEHGLNEIARESTLIPKEQRHAFGKYEVHIAECTEQFAKMVKSTKFQEVLTLHNE